MGPHGYAGGCGCSGLGVNPPTGSPAVPPEQQIADALGVTPATVVGTTLVAITLAIGAVGFYLASRSQ